MNIDVCAMCSSIDITKNIGLGSKSIHLFLARMPEEKAEREDFKDSGICKQRARFAAPPMVRWGKCQYREGKAAESRLVMESERQLSRASGRE